MHMFRAIHEEAHQVRPVLDLVGYLPIQQDSRD